MAVGCQMTRLRRLRLVGAVVVLALASAGCAARWAARQKLRNMVEAAQVVRRSL